MGIGVETSTLGRRAAELATGAIGDDTRQDEDHADDAEEMGDLLQGKPVVPVVAAGCQVHNDVEHARGDHQQQPNPAECWEGGCLENEPIANVYRQHVLVIHARRGGVKSIGNEKV
jgi:hypothetical protein